MDKIVVSTSHVLTERPGRFAKQLTSHFGRKIDTHWDAEVGKGWAKFPASDEHPSEGVCDMVAEDGALVLTLRCGQERVAQLQHVVGSHLVRFGKEGELEVNWTTEG